MKNKWILLAIGLLLACNLIIHLVFVFKETGDSRKLRRLEADLAASHDASRDRYGQLQEQLETLTADQRALERRLTEMGRELQRRRATPRNRYPDERDPDWR